MDALVIYDSLSGNTEKVAQRIYKTSAESLPSQIVKADNDTEIDLLSHDLFDIENRVRGTLASLSAWWEYGGRREHPLQPG